jgi:hypothetical protein
MMPRALILLFVLGAVVPMAAGAAPKAPPDTTITAGPPDPVASSSASFTFTSNVSNGDEVSFACSLDSQTFSSCSSPRVYSNLPDGLHTFFVFAISDGGIDQTPASWTWTIDTTPPQEIVASRTVRYRQLVLSWAPPASFGADHVVVLRSTSPKQQPSVQVYTGAGTSFTEAKFDNGRYHSYRIIGVDRAGNVSHGTDLVVSPSALMLAPADGSPVGRPPALVWRGVPKAGYYNVQLWRAGKKILSAWPRSPLLQLRKKWSYGGHRQQLKAGRYTWFVWPGFGPRAKGSYGQVVGQSSFQVTS